MLAFGQWLEPPVLLFESLGLSELGTRMIDRRMGETLWSVTQPAGVT